ncbi:RADIATION SENSITIVE 17 isoform X2 [Wolffia australiana]
MRSFNPCDLEVDDGDGEAIASSSARLHRSGKRSTSKSRKSPASTKRSRTLRKRGVALMDENHSPEQRDFDALSEDFLECINGVHVTRGKCQSASKRAAINELWVDKHKPHSIADLAVHKKKVEEVRFWLEERIKSPKDTACSYTLLITGKAGVGKSAVIQIIASHLELEVCEWKTPTPTLWKEHLHNSNSSLSYVSKLDEFETFVDTVRRYPVLPSTNTNGLRKPIILLIDDLPVTNGTVGHRRLCECLRILACSALVPTVILVTEYSEDDSNGIRGCPMEEILSTLERVGAHKVCFNQLTVNSIRKVLSAICQREEYSVPEDVLNQIARHSQGDIRHAITSLQYFCLRPENSSNIASTPLKENSNLEPFSSPVSNDASISFGRDDTLSLFHALGKFLHNKRAEGGVEKGAVLDQRFVRLPLKMDAPEEILSQAHAQARPVIDFLHENVLDFLRDESADDAWTVASYLSDADCLLSSQGQRLKGAIHGGELLSQFAAASVAVRGVLFGNSRPSSPRWRSIRRPQLWQAERSSNQERS